MKTLGLRLVLRDPARSAVAIAGIAVAVLIAFVEWGFMNGIIDSHLRLVESARGDLVVLDRRRSNLTRWDGMLAIRASQIAAISGVASISPVYQSGDAFRSDTAHADHRINVIAFAPDDPPFDFGWTADTLALLRQPDTVLMDRLSRPIYGELAPGQDVWIDDRRMRLGGFVTLGPTIVVDGLAVMSEGTFKSKNPSASPKMIVVRLSGGADVLAVMERVRQALGPEVQVFRKGDLAEREVAYLRRVAPLGLLFGAGMFAGLFVGLVICYQVLYIAIRRRIKAFATLKAMGFGRRYIMGTVLQQAAFLGACGYLLGLGASWFAYRVLEERTGLLVALTWQRGGAVAAACLGASIIAGAFAAMKALRAPPAELF